MRSRCQMFSVFLLLVLPQVSHAEEAPKMTGEFTMASGPYEIQITATYACTIRRIIFDGAEIGKATGLYGPIFAPAPGKFIGAGHKEGGLEKVESIALKVGGKKQTPEVGKRYEGKSVVLSKTSLYDHLQGETELELTPDQVTIRTSCEAMEDQKAHSLYIFQFCWSCETKEWIAQCGDDGEMKEGTFVDDKGFRLESDVKWTALYDPAIEKGMLMYFPKVIPGNLRKSCYWDVPKVYHKYYLMMDIPALIPKGRKLGPCTILLKGISAKPAKWKDEAKKLAKQLRKKDPKQ